MVSALIAYNFLPLVLRKVQAKKPSLNLEIVDIQNLKRIA